jgi:hypothetical protein
MHRNIHDPIEEIKEDCLGRQTFARTILHRLVDEECPPAVGLFGDWGTGKSSLLSLMVSLNADPSTNYGGKLRFKVIDAWHYESTGNLFVPIMVWLIKRLKEKGKRMDGWNVAMKRVLLATLMTTAEIGLRVAGIRQLMPDELSDVKDDFVENLRDAADVIDPGRWEKLVDDIEKAQQDFQKIIKLILEDEPYQRLVICIDNLDRCSPENAVHLLESIKNYLTVEGIVWVIAVDPHVISAYIEKTYGTAAIGGYNYLDKIFPEQYHIPPLSIYSDVEGINRLLDRAMGGFSVIRPSDWNRYAQIPRILVPRRLVKSAYKFVEAYRLPSLKGTRANADTVFALILLYYGWPEFYERLSSDRPEHVKGILCNFEESPVSGEVKKSALSLPIPHRFVEDRDLKYYLIQAFLAQGNLDKISEELASAMRWLQQVGLP